MRQSKYCWKNDNSRMLRMLRNSRTMKIKAGWIRDAGAGFIVADILNVRLVHSHSKKIVIRFEWGHLQGFTTADLNLRETEELIKYLETI